MKTELLTNVTVEEICKGFQYSELARLSTFAPKKAEFPKKRGVGLHYTSVFCAATSVDILGGGWSGSVKPSAPSSIATSFFGST